MFSPGVFMFEMELAIRDMGKFLDDYFGITERVEAIKRITKELFNYTYIPEESTFDYEREIIYFSIPVKKIPKFKIWPVYEEAIRQYLGADWVTLFVMITNEDYPNEKIANGNSKLEEIISKVRKLGFDKFFINYQSRTQMDIWCHKVYYRDEKTDIKVYLILSVSISRS